MTKTSFLVFLAACGEVKEPRLAPQLAAVSPALANSGDTLTLDGTFVEPAVATFPGGATAPVTIVGPHRATVVVPDAATSGDLTVAIAGTSYGPLAFRRAPFALGPNPFFAREDQAQGPRQTAVLATPRTFHASLVAGGYAYLLGGLDPSGATLAGIERLRIAADGTLAPGEPAGTLAVARARARALRIGGSVYVFGGVGIGGAALDSVERAPVLADGTLGAFDVVGTLVHARAPAVAAVVGDHVIVTGGAASTERAEIAPDGTLGAFEEVPEIGPAMPASTGAVVGNYLYVFGDAVARAAIEPDGTLHPFELASTHPVAPRLDPAIAVLGRSLYVVGGTDPGSGAKLASVEAARIDADGTLGPFATVADAKLPTPVAGVSIDVIGNALRVIGPAVVHASIDASGQIGAPAEVAEAALATGRIQHAVAQWGDKVYIAGGVGASQVLDSVEIATIRRDGSPSGIAAGPRLTVPRYGAVAVVLGRFLYVLGGKTDTPALATVERAPIAEDGSLGDFADAGVKLVHGRLFSSAVVIDRFLYVVAGVMDVSTIVPTIERAPIGDDGTLGAFADVTTTLATQRFGHTTVVLGDKLYVIGGIAQNGVAPGIASVEVATIQPDGALGAFAAGPALVMGRAGHTSAVIGGSLYAIGGGGVGELPAPILETAAIRGDGSLGAFGQGATVDVADINGNVAAGLFLDGLYWVGGADFSTGVPLSHVSRAVFR